MRTIKAVDSYFKANSATYTSGIGRQVDI